MDAGFSIRAVDPDDDYLGIEVRGWNARFAGSARIYAGLDELSCPATRIEGFPATAQDQRTYDFGSRDPGIAGGFCGLRFRCIDAAGHAVLELSVEDDDGLYAAATARFSIHVDAASIDAFVGELRQVQRSQSGEAMLRASE